MKDTMELVWRCYDELKNWPAVADALGWSPSLWWQVAHGKRKPTREQANAVLRRYGRPEIPPPPSQIVAASGVTYVVRADDNPDTAILARTGGEALARIRLTGAGVPVGPGASEPECRFTSGKAAPKRRKPRAPYVLTLAQIEPVDPRRLGRGRSGNPSAIAEAARRAAASLDIREEL